MLAPLAVRGVEAPAARAYVRRTMSRFHAFLLLAFVPAASAQVVIFADGFEAGCRAAPGGGTAVAMPTLLTTLTASFQEGWLASPAVVDLDNDGTNEIVIGRAQRLIAWRLPNTIAFNRTVPARIWASPVVADVVTASPGLEVFAASGSQVFGYTATGADLPGYPAAWRNELRALAAGDIDGDNDLEIVAVTTTPLDAGGQRDIVMAWNEVGAAIPGYPPNTTGTSGCGATCFVTGGYDQTLGLGNVDADAALEILAPHDNAYMSLHDGNGVAFDSSPIFIGRPKLPGIRFLHNYAEAQQGFANVEETALQAHFTNSAPVFADVDADGTSELVVLASVQNASQSNRQLGVALWAVKSNGTRPPAWVNPFHAPQYLAGLNDLGNNIVAATNSVAVADMDTLRPGREFVFAGFDGRIHAVDSLAQALWSFTYTTDPAVLTGGVVLADLSRDAKPEVVFTTYSTDMGKGRLVILGNDGQLQHSIVLPQRGAMAVPTIADVDRNGTADIVVNLKDAGGNAAAQVWQVPSSNAECLAWPTGRGNYLRNGDVR